MGGGIGNGLLLRAQKVTRFDEFYTRYSDIEAELSHYDAGLFRGRVVYCNCDDPYRSAFVRFFIRNFNRLGLARFIATCYAGAYDYRTGGNLFDVLLDGKPAAPVDERRPLHLEVTRVPGSIPTEDDGPLDVDALAALPGNTLTTLRGNGSYASDECIALLAEADVVVTNPPFTLMRDYLPLVAGSGADYIIMGPLSACAYTRIRPRFVDGAMRFGATRHGGSAKFDCPSGDVVALGTIRWYTNMPFDNMSDRHLETCAEYDPERYPMLDGTSIINVDSYTDIPMDYTGEMAVPITFLDHHDPNQYDLLRVLDNPHLNGRRIFKRCVIMKHTSSDNQAPGAR